MKQIPWTKRKYERFLDVAILTECEKRVLDSRVIKDMSRVQIAMTYSISVATVDRIIKSLREKYDQVQTEYPDEFSVRRR